MDIALLELSQRAGTHPVAMSTPAVKTKYIDTLREIRTKCIKRSRWADAILQLCSNEINNKHESTSQKGSGLFKFRYDLLFDSLMMGASGNQKQAEKIYREVVIRYHKRYHNDLRKFYEALFNSETKLPKREYPASLVRLWRKNSAFHEQEPIKVLITATMSAGKSTLINALAGRKISKTTGTACTAKTHMILNKAYDDGLCYEYDHALELDASEKLLMEDNSKNKGESIVVGTYFRSFTQPQKRIWLIDTPGVNSSRNVNHRQITYNTVKNTTADLMIVLLNGENLGTNDEMEYLRYLRNNYNKRIIFAVNKLDSFHPDEDSVIETLKQTEDELSTLGFQSPQVVPISSKAAFLAKCALFGDDLTQNSEDELKWLSNKMRCEEFQFDRYYPNIELSGWSTKKPYADVLAHSGLMQLEKIIYQLR